MNAAPERITEVYRDEVCGLVWCDVGGGYSGSRVWCGQDSTGRKRFALKQWPAETSEERLNWVHSHIPSHPAVPSLRFTVNGQSYVRVDHRLYEVSEWKPGTPVLTPSLPQIQNAMRSLAEIHAQWESMAVKQQAIPAVHRRLILFREAIPGLNNMPPDLAAARDACIQLQNTVWDRLRVWADLQWPCHPCFCDLHADHVLFSGETVTGMVDFGAMKIDHPAIDLARLLGDYSDSIHNVWGLALEEYHRCRPGLEIPLGLVKTLALSTAVGGLKHWLHRATAGDQRVFHESVGFRLQRLRLRAFRLIE